MQVVAQLIAEADLTANGFNCSSTSAAVSVDDTPTAGSVTVTVTCRVTQQGTQLLGGSVRTVTASSTEIIDRYRAG